MTARKIQQWLESIIKVKRIQEALENALINDSKMRYELYEYELEEHLDYWKSSMIMDKDDFVFAVTVRRNDVTMALDKAMLLIEKSEEAYINESARERLKELWKNAYSNNIKMLAPQFAKQINSGEIAFTGVKTSDTFKA